MHDRKNQALRRLKLGMPCKNCKSKAVVVYCTSCHGDWFLCKVCSNKWEKQANKILKDKMKG